MLVIGNEILSGRTRDSNMYHLASELTKRGIEFREARFVADDQNEIVTAVNQLRNRYDHVFTSGGIGPTHDDITASSIAVAFGVPIDVRDDARHLLETHYRAAGRDLNSARLRMARIPEGALLITNSISAAPGFTIGNVHVLAGVPAIFRSMLSEVLAKLPLGHKIASQSVRIMQAEGDIALPLAEIAKTHREVAIGSYPFIEAGRFGVDIVLRGRSHEQLKAAFDALKSQFGTATEFEMDQ